MRMTKKTGFSVSSEFKQFALLLLALLLSIACWFWLRGPLHEPDFCDEVEADCDVCSGKQHWSSACLPWSICPGVWSCQWHATIPDRPWSSLHCVGDGPNLDHTYHISVLPVVQKLGISRGGLIPQSFMGRYAVHMRYTNSMSATTARNVLCSHSL